MAIGVNSSVSRADLPATTATTTISKPTGTGNTGVLVVVFGTDQSGTPGSITPPAGGNWTAIFTNVLVTVGSTGVRLSGFWALGSVTNLGFTNSTTGDQQGWVCREFTGVDNANPIDVVDNTGANHNTGSASLTVNSVTVATANAWELIAFASWLGGTNSATGFTAAQNVVTPPATNADVTLLHNATPKGTGSTGTVTVTSSAAASGQILIGVPFALRDAGAPPIPAVSLLASTFVTTAATSYTTASATPTGNNLLLAVCAVTGSVATDWAVTDSLGGAWTKVTASRAQKGTNVDEMEVWVRNALTSSALTVTYSHVSGSATGGGLVVLQVTNMTRTGASAVRGAGVQSNQALGTAPTPVLPATTLTANPTIWAVHNATALASTPLTDPANWTRRANLSYATPTTGIQVATRDSGFTGTTITGGSNSGSAYSSLGIELDASAASVTGNASATLGALAGAAAAAVAVVGNAAATLGPLLGQAAASAGGGSTAAAAATLDPLTGSGSVTVRNPPSANAAATLGPLTGTAQAAVAVKGQAAATLGPLAGTASVVVAATGRAAATLAPLTGTAQAAVAVKGTASVTLGALSGAASVTVPAVATGAATFGPLLGQASAVVVSGRTASGQATLGPLTGAAAAAVAVRAQAAAGLDPLSGSASAAVAVRAQAAGTFESLTGQAAALVPVTAQATAALGALTGQAAVLVSGGGAGVVGAAAGLLGPLTGAAAARVADVARVRWRDHGRAKEQRWRTPS